MRKPMFGDVSACQSQTRVDISATIAKTLLLFLKWPLNKDHGDHSFE